MRCIFAPRGLTTGFDPAVAVAALQSAHAGGSATDGIVPRDGRFGKAATL